MIHKEKLDENYMTTAVFDKLKKGDMALVPFESKVARGIRMEATRRNREYRIKQKKDSISVIMFRVSTIENKGFTTIRRIN